MEIKETFCEKHVKMFYNLLAHEKETEIRLIDPHGQGHPQSKFVSNIDDFVTICKEYNGKYNIYAGINERKHFGREKADVISVKTVVIDIDPTRPDMKQPSNQAELKNALDTGKDIQDFIMKDFQLISYSAMSGNGVQIYIPLKKIELSDIKDNREPIENYIKALHKWLAQKFNSVYIKIDNIGDLPRIIKVIGTISIKGIDTVERPHRLSYWLDSFEKRYENDDNEKIFNIAFSSIEGKIKERNNEDKLSITKHPKYSIIFQYDYNKHKQRKTTDKSIIKMLQAEDDCGYKSTSEKEFAILIKLQKYRLSLEEIDHIMSSFESDKWINSPKQYKEMSYEKTREIVEKDMDNPMEEISKYLNLNFRCIKIYPNHDESITEMFLSEDEKIILDNKSITTPTKFRGHYYMLRSEMLPNINDMWWYKILTLWTKSFGIKIDSDKMVVKDLDEYTIIRDAVISELQSFDLTDKIDESVMYGKMFAKDNLDSLVYIYNGHMLSILKKNKYNITLAKLSHALKNDLASKTKNMWINSDKQERFWVVKRNIFKEKRIPEDKVETPDFEKIEVGDGLNG